MIDFKVSNIYYRGGIIDFKVSNIYYRGGIIDFKVVISIIVAVSSILRCKINYCSDIKHFVGGALTLCAMGIGVAAMTDLPALITSVIIASAAVFCSSMSRIHSGNNSSIGGILIWLGRNNFPCNFNSNYHKRGLTPAPWVKGSLWGVLTVGILLGFQIFAFSRCTLRNAIAKDLSDKAFYGYICTTFILMSIWTFIGFWAGICVSVVFNDTTEELLFYCFTV
ncbi:hypothetical protein Anas_07253 [Armadillidium nasatum]|uniref:Uncharacterized protein n=1 Tax=Armadillidium nasatum TaxID=96803 RepID=A0A5N5STP2_9CRUS|nr:hypothetical protein Anas_07253 [Armadillidium nasatum]